jgi:hypothetical protein
MNKRLARELKRRGKSAVTLVSLLPKGLKDPPLLERLQAKSPDCVLLTTDDAMPIDHPVEVANTSIAIAIVHPDRESSYTPDQWDAEIVHRWAHRMELQTIGTVRRYTLNGHSPWKVRKRPRPAIVRQIERQLKSR